MYDKITWFIIGFMVGVYRKEIYNILKKEYEKTPVKKEV